MAALVQVEANGLLNASFAGQAAYAAGTSPFKGALISTTTPSTNTTAGSEVSGGSYARQTLTAAAASAGSASSNVALTYTSMPAVTSVAGVEVWDSAGTPVRRWFGLLAANKTTNAGDTFTIASGSLTATLS